VRACGGVAKGAVIARQNKIRDQGCTREDFFGEAEGVPRLVTSHSICSLLLTLNSPGERDEDSE
jgi:hypothetical protein